MLKIFLPLVLFGCSTINMITNGSDAYNKNLQINPQLYEALIKFDFDSSFTLIDQMGEVNEMLYYADPDAQARRDEILVKREILKEFVGIAQAAVNEIKTNCLKDTTDLELKAQEVACLKSYDYSSKYLPLSLDVKFANQADDEDAKILPVNKLRDRCVWIHRVSYQDIAKHMKNPVLAIVECYQQSRLKISIDEEHKLIMAKQHEIEELKNKHEREVQDKEDLDGTSLLKSYCWSLQVISKTNQEVQRENMIGKETGYVNQQKMYDYGQTLVDFKARAKNQEIAYRKLTGKVLKSSMCTGN